MRKIKVGLVCNERHNHDDCSCVIYDFPYGLIHRTVCEIIQVEITEEDDYISWMDVLSQYPSLGLTRDEFFEKFGYRRFYAEDDLHSFRK